MKISYPTSGCVSIWIGTIATENDLDKFVENEIAPELRLNKPLSKMSEVCFEEEAIPVRSLIEGFSGWKTFIDQAEAVALSNGITTANAALVCYYLKCEDSPMKWGCMYYLGSFVGQDIY